MDLKEIKLLVKFLSETDVTEISIEKEGEKLKIKRGETVKNYPPPYMVHDRGLAARTHSPEQGTKTFDDEEKKKERPLNHKLISAPMVGTFYRCPSPESPPYVEVGQTVKKGQVLCIIEAMKLMNEIESEHSGKIVEILVENGQPVEYGEQIFVIET